MLEIQNFKVKEFFFDLTKNYLCVEIYFEFNLTSNITAI